MTRVLLIIISTALAACSSATLYQSNGRLSGSYSLTLERVVGPVDTAAVRSAMIGAFAESGITIDPSAPRKITCTCDLSFVRKDFVVLATPEYLAAVRCSSEDASFDAVGSRSTIERFFTGLGAGLYLGGLVPWYALASGVVADGLIVSNTSGAYNKAIRKAILEGTEEPRPSSKSKSSRR